MSQDSLLWDCGNTLNFFQVISEKNSKENSESRLRYRWDKRILLNQFISSTYSCNPLGLIANSMYK